MDWNAFDLFDGAISRTKKLLFPVNFGAWMKLGFVSLFSAGNGSKFSLTNNFRGILSNDKTSGLFKNGAFSLGGITGAIIAGLVVLFGILSLIFTYVTSVFSFIFLDALTLPKYSIRNSWENNSSKGFSLLLFRIIFAFVVLVGLLILFLPFILQLFSYGVENYFDSASLQTILLSIIPSTFLAILWIIFVFIFSLFVFDFALVDLYKNGFGITESIRKTILQVRSYKAESFIYLLAVIVISIALSILSGIIAILLLIPFGIILLVIGLPLFLLSKIVFWIVFAIFVIPVIFFYSYLFSVLVLPFTCFRRYFALLGYEKLFNVKILKDIA